MMARLSRLPRLAAIVAVALVATMIYLVVKPDGGMRLTAYFTQTVGLYKGDRVTLMGMPIGTITSIQPRAHDVKVDMVIDRDVELPADAKAAITSPALVAVRTIALGPAYTHGPRLASGATIPVSRTSEPVEWDDVKQQLTNLATALGPANKQGNEAIKTVISGSAHLLDGRGDQMHQTLEDLSTAMRTLSDNGGNIFATVRNLQVFADALNSSDQAVRTFNTTLADVSSALAGDGTQLQGALRQLRLAFVQVKAFLRKNTGVTASTLHTLRSTTSVIAEDRQALADLLQLAPTTLSNFYDILDARNNSLTGVIALENLKSPAQIVCAFELNLGGSAKNCETTLQPLLKYLSLSPPDTGIIPPIGLPGAPGTGTGGHTGSGGGLGGLLGGLLGSGQSSATSGSGGSLLGQLLGAGR